MILFCFYFSGGREVYSQSKSRSARHKNRHRQSGEFKGQPQQQLPPQVTSEVNPEVTSVPSPYQPQQQGPCKVLKETVFSSEIHSIEYNSPMASMASLSSGSSNDSPKVSARHVHGPPAHYIAATNRPGMGAKNINVDTGVVVFDDIKDCDVNVTYDLIEGEFPPPNISGLIVRDPNDLLTSDDLPVRVNRSDDDVDGQSQASSGGSKIIGDITIAEYEGSPRRYRPRAGGPGGPEPEGGAPTTKPVMTKRPLKLPGFPQRVLPQPEQVEPTAAEPNKIEPMEPEEELLKFEDDQASSEPPTSASEVKSDDYDSKMRYEFSETRKVLDEFFHKESEVTQVSFKKEFFVNLTINSIFSAFFFQDVQGGPPQGQDFSDLNYVLRKNNNYVGQRLAASEAEDGANEISPELEQHIQQPSTTHISGK